MLLLSVFCVLHVVHKAWKNHSRIIDHYRFCDVTFAPIGETRVWADGRVQAIPSSTIVEEPFAEWFDSHVINDDTLTVLQKDPLKYDLENLRESLKVKI